MNSIPVTARVLHLEKNMIGRDFVVGDMHGCLDQFNECLLSVEFNKHRDRVISVGDFINRGPHSEECIRLLRKSWYFAVRGNHEQMLINYAKHRADAEFLLRHGGQWAINASDKELNYYSKVLNALPIAIDIETDAGLVGIVHAECNYQSWDEFLRDLNNPNLSKQASMNLNRMCLWSTDRHDTWNNTPIEGVYKVVVGHLSFAKPVRIANVHYLDTGAGRNSNCHLSILQVN